MPVSLRPGPDYSFSAALPSLLLSVFKDVLSLVSQTLRLNVPFIKVNYLLVAVSSQHTEQPLLCSGAEWLQTVARNRVLSPLTPCCVQPGFAQRAERVQLFPRC